MSHSPEGAGLQLRPGEIVRIVHQGLHTERLSQHPQLVLYAARPLLLLAEIVTVEDKQCLGPEAVTWDPVARAADVYGSTEWRPRQIAGAIAARRMPLLDVEDRTIRARREAARTTLASGLAKRWEKRCARTPVEHYPSSLQLRRSA